MKIQVRGGSCLNYKGDAILLFHFSDVRPLTGNLALLDWRCNAAVSILWKNKMDLLKFGQLTIIATQGKIPVDTVILTGLGESGSFDHDLRKEACRLALEAALKVGGAEVAVDGETLAGGLEKEVVEDLRSALVEIENPGRFKISLFAGSKEHKRSRGLTAGAADGAS